MPDQPDETPSPTASYLAFDGMTWPNPHDPRGVEHRLRYGGETQTDLVVAASFIAAYRQLVDLPRRTREERITGIRKALDDLGKETDHA